MFFVVSGGPYGLEEIVASQGYLSSLLLLLIVPIVWSIPAALMVGELSTTLPLEGGYYTWVRRALGPFWATQEAWLMVAFSLFDMAIYPTLLVTYLSRFFPLLQDTSFGAPGWIAGALMIVLCVLWNLRGSRAVGSGSIALGIALLAPFVALTIAGLFRLVHTDYSTLAAILAFKPAAASPGDSGWIAGLLVCMWNYLGWDNASTVAAEVDRPQKTYPRALLVTVLIVAGFYTVPLLFAATSGLAASEWTNGSWVEVARRLGGLPLAVAMAIGGALCGLGMFNVLILAHSRLPLAMVRDRMLPRWLGRRDPHTGAPRRIILIAAVLYALCMGLGFKRLVIIDVILYGGALALQILSLVVLRIREPHLARPFRVPGGRVGLALVAASPLILLGGSIWAGRAEPGIWGLGSIELGLCIALLGPVLYGVQRLARRAGSPRPAG